MRSLKHKKKIDKYGYLLVDTTNRISTYILRDVEIKNKECIDVLFDYLYDSYLDLYGKKISKSAFNKVKQHITTQYINHKSKYSYLDLNTFRFQT